MSRVRGNSQVKMAVASPKASKRTAHSSTIWVGWPGKLPVLSHNLLKELTRNLRLSSMFLHFGCQRKFDQAPDCLRAGGIVTLGLSPTFNIGLQSGRKSQRQNRILPGWWATAFFSYYGN